MYLPERPAWVPYGTLTLFLTVFDHLPHSFKLCTTPHAPCAVIQLVPDLCCVLIGACDPM